jgi:hypothetical protein
LTGALFTRACGRGFLRTSLVSGSRKGNYPLDTSAVESVYFRAQLQASNIALSRRNYDMRDNPLDVLVGEEINAVCFVMDYVEVHFNGPILRSLTNPVVEFKGERYEFPLPGSRDVLCSLIGSEVGAVELDDFRFIRLRTRAEHGLITPLDQSSRVGPEAVHFVPGVGEPILVW